MKEENKFLSVNDFKLYLETNFFLLILHNI